MVDRILPYPPRKDQLNRAKIGHSPARKPEQLLEPSPLSHEALSHPTLNPMVISLEETRQRRFGNELIIPEKITKAVKLTLQSPLEVIKTMFQSYDFTALWNPEDPTPLTITGHLSTGRYQKPYYINLTKDLPNIQHFLSKHISDIQERNLLYNYIGTQLIPSEIIGKNWQRGSADYLLNPEESDITSLTAIIPNSHLGKTTLIYLDQTFYDYDKPRGGNTAILLVNLPTTTAEKIMPDLQSHPPGFFYTLANTLLAQHGEDAIQIPNRGPETLSAFYPNTVLTEKSNNLVVTYPKFPNKKINSHTTTAHPPLFQ